MPQDFVPSPAPVPLTIHRSEPEAGVLCLWLQGVLDPSTIEILRHELDAAIRFSRRPLVVLDLSQVTHVSTSGWGTVISFLRPARESSGAIRVCGLSEKLTTAFNHLGLGLHIRRFPDAASAARTDWNDGGTVRPDAG